MVGEYRTNPSFVCKKVGATLSGWVIDAHEYRAVSAAELMLLNACCEPRTIEQVWSEWTRCGVAGEVSVPSSARLQELAGKLRQCGYLIAAEGVGPFPDLRASSIAESGAGPQVRASALKLHPSFALRPTPNGLAAWSAAQQRYFLVPDEAIGALPGLLRADAASDTASHSGRTKWQAALHSVGILAEPEPGPRADEPHPGVLKSPIHMESLLAELKFSDKKEVKMPDITGLTFAPRASGSRAPVYLCCCIDNVAHAGWLPLALGMIAAYARSHQGGVLDRHFEIVPEFLCSPRAVFDAVARRGPGILLMSDYEWTIRENLPLSARLRELFPEMIIVHGGPSAPKYEGACQEFLRDHPHVDVVVRGEGELTVAELLAALAGRTGGDRSLACLAVVPGLTFRRVPGSEECIRTADRERSETVDEFPSPYLTGLFDDCPTHLLGAATLETNRGCPYGCTYCDWGSATLQKIRKFDLERVRQEIEWIGQRQIPILWCADANFGIFERDVEIAQMIVDTFKRYGAPKELVVNYAKNATTRVAKIVEMLTRAGVAANPMISIQTTDATVLSIVKRSNIKTKMYDELLAAFRKERLQVSTDLLIGLPGATVESFKRDLQYYLELEVPAKAYVLTVLPNSPMAEPSYMEKYQIVKDAQGFVHSTFSYTNSDLKLMAQIYHTYCILIMYSLFKYGLMFVQWEHRIRAIDFIHALVNRMRKDPASLPTVAWVMQCFHGMRTSCGGWHTFVRELAEFARQEFDVPTDGAFAAILDIQESVLADHGRRLPLQLKLEHDVASYVTDRRNKSGKRLPLRSYPPASTSVSDPLGLCLLDPERHIQYGRHAMAWELESSLKIDASAVHFMELEGAQVEPGATIFSHDCKPFSFEEARSAS